MSWLPLAVERHQRSLVDPANRVVGRYCPGSSTPRRRGRARRSGGPHRLYPEIRVEDLLADGVDGITCPWLVFETHRTPARSTGSSQSSVLHAGEEGFGRSVGTVRIRNVHH